MRILLVEDDSDLANWLTQSLQNNDVIIDWEEDGLVACRRAFEGDYDAVVLDLGLPRLDGSGVLDRLRAGGFSPPILVMTARDSLVERVALLRAGADDFLAKPFAIEELEARLIALVRRSLGKADGTFKCGSLTYEQATQKFTLSGQVMPLSPREHAVLRILITRQGEPRSKQQILDRLVSLESDLQPDAIEVIIHRLRRRLGDADVQIVTLRGIGYFLEEKQTAEAI